MTRFVPRTVRLVGFVVTLLAVGGCGGGGGGSHSTSESLVGRYLGTANSVLTGPRSSTPVNGAIQFDVAADNTVTVSDPGQAPHGRGTLSGNSFTASTPGSTLSTAPASAAEAG